jgi:hypothetical protein
MITTPKNEPTQSELLLYRGSYLLDRGIRVKHTDSLSKVLIASDKPLPNMNFHSEYDLVAGIIQRLGHQHLARDYVDTEQGTQRVGYHLACFIMFTKSNFDFIAHLINRVLELDYHSKNVDLSHSDFRNDVLEENHELGSTINHYSSWINEVTDFRTAIEHNKVVPVLFVGPMPPKPGDRLYFPKTPLSYTELITLFEKKQKPELKETIAFCDTSLENTLEIVEKTFGVTSAKLTI